MDKQLFLQVFNNIVLSKSIFNFIVYIHRYCFNHLVRLKWNQLIRNPKALVGNGYIKLLKDYLNTVNNNNSNNRDNSDRIIEINKEQNDIIVNITDALVFCIRFDRLELLEIIIGMLTAPPYNLECIKPFRIIKVKQYLNMALNNFNVATEESGNPSSDDLMYYASLYGRLDILKYLDANVDFKTLVSDNQRYFNDSRQFQVGWDYYKAMTVSPASGSMNTLVWLSTKMNENGGIQKYFNMKIIHTTIENAALYGRYEMIQWLVDNRISERRTFMVPNAVCGGHINILEWLDQNNYDFGFSYLMDSAAIANQWEVLKWLHEHDKGGMCVQAMNYAAEIGNLDILKWIHYNRTESWTSDVMDQAATRGHLHIVKWLHQNRTEGCTTDAIDGASMFNRLEVVDWLYKNRTEGCTGAAYSKAIANGSLDTLKFLHKNIPKVTFTKEDIYEAIQNHHYETILWLLETFPERFDIDQILNISKQHNFNGIFEIISNLNLKSTINIL
ncbi:hypothetical protein PPL_02899 [Heterostelium album PN500]|uniref:Ankyrin repeat protein n=1 Tax=Heterostelium pallidum (strain ATCC 26659 / Pp 5 / PN500) TaxID=670386 RepID=D3B3D3_HETP5|nr:hypothetical protein PPL_02899 [Heterostelium album PN500]EFA83831.1 hypothetical protein PPL_02899 [Heterostelium album PN500]|eukprot:XP_020435948.1 hypothetical protein PPL_02899 [Heterostelium album PN500]